MRKLSPKMIKEYLDNYVIGQEEAKRSVSLALFLHIAKYTQNRNAILNNEILPDANLFKKSNLMIFGPTGSGKTYMIEKASEIIYNLLGLAPLLKIDASLLTPEGIIGSSLIDYFMHHYKEYGIDSDTGITAFKSSIVYLDEIDKICYPKNTTSGDQNKEVQYQLLKIVEGAEIPVQKSSVEKVLQTESTQNMLFIFSGNFPESRSTPNPMGFQDNMQYKTKKTYQQRLQNCGLATQLVGRISMYAETKKLEVDDLINIIYNSKDSIYRQYKQFLAKYNQEIDITDFELRELVEACKSNDTGARGLQSEIEKKIENQLYNLEMTF